MSVTMIAIAGGSASGKTSLANWLLRRFKNEDVGILSVDHYYHSSDHIPLADRGKLNVDHPTAIDSGLLYRQLSALKQGEAIEVPTYDFTLHVRERNNSRTLHPHRFILVEGIFALYFQDIRDLYSYSVFIDTPADIRFGRRLERDVQERGRTPESVLSQWEATVEPMYQQFCAPTRRFASEVLTGDTWTDSQVSELWQRMQGAIPQ